jgi:hypothetical protein
MPRYKLTLHNGTSSDKTFESDFQAVNETHRPTETGAGIVQVDRYAENGGVAAVWSAPAKTRS